MTMDWASIVPAVITGLLSLAGVYFANRKSSALIEYRLKELEKKQDAHNDLITRMTVVEAKMNMYHGKGATDGAK